MTSPRLRTARRLTAGVAVVLAVGLAGLLVRGVVGGHRGADPAALPVRTTPGGQPFSLDAARSRAVPPGTSLIATARGAIRVYRAPGARHGRLLRRRVFHGRRIPLTFLVRAHRRGWALVELPTRPNLATGWVRRRDVRYSVTGFAVVVRLRSHRLELRRGRRIVLRAPVGVGRSLSPTPLGRYYVTDVVRPPDPHGFFGPYALGLSAHSPVLTSFEGGDGQVGLHGTNDPAGLGADVSHGCIRMANAVVSRLAHTVPLGTPVDIRR